MKDNRIEKAMELALSCRICKSMTDAEYNKETNEWTTYCDCGKTDRHHNSYIIKETTALIKTLPKKRHV